MVNEFIKTLSSSQKQELEKDIAELVSLSQVSFNETGEFSGEVSTNLDLKELYVSVTLKMEEVDKIIRAQIVAIQPISKVEFSGKKDIATMLKQKWNTKSSF